MQHIGRDFAAEDDDGIDADGQGTTKKKKKKKKVVTSAGNAKASASDLAIPSLGQLARDILELLGAVMDEEEKRRGQNDPKVTPWGSKLRDGFRFIFETRRCLRSRLRLRPKPRLYRRCRWRRQRRRKGIPALFLMDMHSKQPRHRRMRKFGGMLRWEWRLGAISTSKSQGKCKRSRGK